MEVWANDSGGGSTHTTVTVTVASLSVISEGVPLWFWAAPAALIAIDVVGAAFLVLALRRGKARP